MAFPKFWCPHDSNFLNWRYLDHPTWSHQALAVVENDRPAGYCVIRFEEGAATLTEFACPQSSPKLCRGLLAGAIQAARAADCNRLNFFSPNSWRHWPLFRWAGFLPYTTTNYMLVGGKKYEPDSKELENWQTVPGDRDYR